ncbi:unnamed protein product [Closterium sp. NIES-54]
MPSSFSPALDGASSSHHRQIAPPPKVDRPLSLEAVADWLVLSNGARFGLDIGGTLCKLVCYEPHGSSPDTEFIRHSLDGLSSAVTVSVNDAADRLAAVPRRGGAPAGAARCGGKSAARGRAATCGGRATIRSGLGRAADVCTSNNSVSESDRKECVRGNGEEGAGKRPPLMGRRQELLQLLWAVETRQLPRCDWIRECDLASANWRIGRHATLCRTPLPHTSRTSLRAPASLVSPFPTPVLPPPPPLRPRFPPLRPFRLSSAWPPSPRPPVPPRAETWHMDDFLALVQRRSQGLLAAHPVGATGHASIAATVTSSRHISSLLHLTFFPPCFSRLPPAPTSSLSPPTSPYAFPRAVAARAKEGGGEQQQGHGRGELASDWDEVAQAFRADNDGDERACTGYEGEEAGEAGEGGEGGEGGGGLQSRLAGDAERAEAVGEGACVEGEGVVDGVEADVEDGEGGESDEESTDGYGGAARETGGLDEKEREEEEEDEEEEDDEGEEEEDEDEEERGERREGVDAGSRAEESPPEQLTYPYLVVRWEAVGGLKSFTPVFSQSSLSPLFLCHPCLPLHVWHTPAPFWVLQLPSQAAPEAPYHHLPAAHLFPPFHPANCPVPTPLLSSLLSSSLFSLSRPLLPSPLLSSHLLSSPLFSPSHPHLASPCQLQGGHAPGIEGRQHVCGHASGRHLRWGLCSQIAIVSATQCMSLVLPHGLVVLTVSGGDYTEMGLAATTVASSLGKLVRPADKASPSRRPENLAKAVLLMVTNNIGSIAMLHARPAGVRHVLFTGSFMHNNKLAMRSLAVAMQFWSNGAMKVRCSVHANMPVVASWGCSCVPWPVFKI